MMQYRIQTNTITDFLLKIYKASLYSLVDENLSFMDEYWERGFKEEALKSIRQTKEKYTLKISEEKKYLDSFEDSCKIIDSVMLRGLASDR